MAKASDGQASDGQASDGQEPGKVKLCPFLQQPTPHTSLEIFLQEELTKLKEASDELSQTVNYEENVLFYRLLLCAGR